MYTLHTSALDAVKASIARRTVVHATQACAAELQALCKHSDDYVGARRSGWEYWGCLDGQHWRVRVPFDA